MLPEYQIFDIQIFIIQPVVLNPLRSGSGLVLQDSQIKGHLHFYLVSVFFILTNLIFPENFSVPITP